MAKSQEDFAPNGDRPEAHGAANYRELLKSKFKFQKRERSIENKRNFKGIDIEEVRKARMNSNRNLIREARSTDAATRKQIHFQNVQDAFNGNTLEAQDCAEKDENKENNYKDNKQDLQDDTPDNSKAGKLDEADIVKKETENLKSFKEQIKRLRESYQQIPKVKTSFKATDSQQEDDSRTMHSASTKMAETKR